jgi:hypothetical protein
VIKIRYDLIRKNSINTYTEYEVFDYYRNLMDLEHGEDIQLFTPEVSLNCNKMVYMTQSANSHRIADHYQDHNHSAKEEGHDHLEFLPSKIIIMPFLHERKIYFSRTIQFYDYFYFSVRREEETLMVMMNL